MGKKAQVTLFIIVGMILLIFVGLFYNLKDNLSLQQIFIPKEIIPVTTYAQQCIHDAAQDAVFLASMQGGYIDLPQKIVKDKFSYLNNGYKVPYWYYAGEDRSPSMNTFVYNLESHINEKTLSCINNFAVFEEQYNFTPIKDITTKVNLNDQEMIIETTINTQVTPLDKNKVIEFPKLKVIYPTKIKKLFSLAKEIMLKENTEFFLESLTDDMIASSDYLPYNGMEITCDQRLWRVDEMALYIKNMIMHNFQFLTFENTHYVQSDEPYFQKQYHFPLKGNDYHELQVNTIYNPQWDINLEVSPSKEGIVKPIEFTMSNFLFACFKLYNHKYSVHYPILFQIVDKDDPNTVFYLATPVILKRNEPNRYNEVPLWPTELDAVNSAQFCGQNQTVTKMLINDKKQIVAQTVVDQKLKNKATVYVNDASVPGDQQLLDNVSISYQCVRFKCQVGKTAYPKDPFGVFTGLQPYFTGAFPDCENGIIIAEKEGYLQTKQRQTIDDTTNGYTVNLAMIPLKQFKLRVHVFDDSSENIERDLHKNEAVLITLKNKEKEYSKTLYYPGQDQTVDLMLAELPYEVTIQLIEDEQIVGSAKYTWNPALDQLQLRGGVLFFVPRINQQAGNSQQIINNLQTSNNLQINSQQNGNLVAYYQQLEDAQKKYKDQIEPRLTLG